MSRSAKIRGELQEGAKQVKKTFFQRAVGIGGTAVFACAFLVNSAYSQEVRDYYEALTDTRSLHSLRTIERNHYHPGAEWLQRGRYQRAQPEFEFVLRWFPNHPQALAGIAQAALGMKRPEIAERYFEIAFSRFPQHDETYMVYGTFLYKTRRIEAAITEYKKALELNPNSAIAHYNLGLAFVATGNFQQANKHAQSAYQLGVDLPGLKRQLEAAKAWDPAPVNSQ